jgi:hypothetical protein
MAYPGYMLGGRGMLNSVHGGGNIEELLGYTDLL